MRKIKRFLSIILILAIIIPIIPIGEIVAYAADEAKIKSISINKTYDSITDLGKFFITITGDNLDRAEIQILKSEGELVRPVKGQGSGRYVAQYSHQASEIGEKLYINGVTYTLGEDSMPKITGRGDATSNIVEAGENVILTGEKLENLFYGVTPEVEGYFSQASSNVKLTPSDISYDNNNNNQPRIEKNVGSVLGNHSLIFKQKTQEHGIPVELEHTYKSIIIVRGELTVLGDVSLFPTQGPTESLVTVTADRIESDVSVFFMKKGEEFKYTKDNMALNESISHGEEAGKEKLRFRVPKKIVNGAYELVITNRVNPDEPLNPQISKYKLLGNGQGQDFEALEYLVVDGSSAVILNSIDPNYSSEKGIPAKIEGQRIGRISPNLYENGELIDPGKNDNIGRERELIIEYRGGKYNDKEVDTITRKITMQIGGRAWITGYNFTGDPYDYLNIIVPENDDPDKLVKDVILSIENTIKFKDGTEVSQFEGDTLVNGFTYKQMDYEPKINTITPSIVQVDKNRMVTEDVIISITGESFMKYGYIEDGKLKVKNPEISIANQDGSRDWFDNKNIRLFDGNGVEIEDKEEEQFANIAKIKIKKGITIPEALVDTTSNLRLQNPLAIESDGDRGSSAFGEIRFIEVAPDKTPNIRSVEPNTVTTDGQRGVKIVGSKFGRNVKVYLDGDEIRGVKRNGTGTELEFDAPPKLEGRYQIIVQNEEGGLATFDEFDYTKTYTDIKLDDFNPKKGGANTLVTVKGSSFVEPDALVADLEGVGIYKLIGTRVLLGGKDVNSYYEENGKVRLQDYTAPGGNRIIRVEENKVKLSDYYHSVILEDEDIEGKYYTIFNNTFSGEIEISDGDQEKYIVERDGSNLVARKGGQEFDLRANNTSLKIGDKTLKYKTPYEVKGGIISGNRVKVIDSGELIFTIAPKEREGFYDLTVLNPDTKRDSKTGDKGFYYFFQPEYNPKIEDIRPDAGSQEGGYYINIEGTGFVDNGGDDKTSVIIGDQVVSPKDIEVSLDQKNLKVKVPKYSGNLAQETDMDRKAVAVVVLNPDGGSDSWENGFSYIIPISNPKITKLILKKGSAAGGDNIVVEGSGFRYFEPFEDLNNNTKWDEDEPYTELNYNNKWDDLRHWLTPKNKADYDKLAKDYDKLVKPILPKVYFGGEEAEIVDFTQNSMEIRTPSGVAGDAEVYVVNNDYGISNTLIFKYEKSKPNIDSVTPRIGSKEGREEIEILGREFKESKIQMVQKPIAGGPSIEDGSGGGDGPLLGSGTSMDKKQAKTKEEGLQIIQFGNPKDLNISNSTVDPDADANTGRVKDNLSTIKVGNLTVMYDGVGGDRKLHFHLVEDEKEYNLRNVDFNSEEIFLPLSLLEREKEEGETLEEGESLNYSGYELVRIGWKEIEAGATTKRIVVDRGFSPQVYTRNSGKHLLVQTPSYYTIGKVPLIIINPDGGEIEDEFEYKNPDSNPEITGIQRENCNPINGSYLGPDYKDALILKVNYGAESRISIDGKDFRQNARVQISDLATIDDALLIKGEESEDDRLTFRMPKISEDQVGKVVPIFVVNEDGGVASSLNIEPKIFIEITKGDSDPKVNSIEPAKGSASGGTRVIIKGSDFRKDEKVSEENKNNKECRENRFNIYFGDEQVRDFISIENNYAEVVVPESAKAGDVEVRVVNPDGQAAENKPIFTYISKPKIKDMNPKTIFTNDEESVVTIEGQQFDQGAKVVVGGKLVATKDLAEGSEVQGSGIAGVDENGKNIEMSVVGGNLANVQGLGDEGLAEDRFLKVTFAEAVDLENSSIIIINPDGGISDPYDGFEYADPVPLKPMVLEAIPGFESTVQLLWNKSDPKILNSASKYEIYGRKTSEKENLYLGDTTDAGFLVRGLEPNVEYEFLVRALNEHGAAIEFASVKVKTLSVGEDKKQKEKEEKLKEEQNVIETKGKEEVQDGRLVVTLGSDSFKNGIGSLDLALAKYKDQDKFTIAVPLALARRDNRLTIKDGTMTSVLNVRDLYTLAVSRLDKGDKDAYVRIHFNRTKEDHIPRGKRVGSQAYEIYFDYAYGKESIEIKDMLRSGQVSLSQNTIVYPNRKNVAMYKFDVASGKYVSLGASKTDLKGKTKLILLSDR